jgi:hypothetical protein
MGVVIEMAGEISFSAQGNSGRFQWQQEDSRSADCPTGKSDQQMGRSWRTRPGDTGAGDPATPELHAASAGPADPWYELTTARCAGNRAPRPAHTQERFALTIGMNDA